jgi:hypothetical protein
MSEMREMTDKELDAVCGGKYSNYDSYNTVTQSNSATQMAVAMGGDGVFFSGNAFAKNWLIQSNVNII